MSDFEVVSYNVNGLGDDRKRRKIFNYMKKHTSGKSIVLLQETHSTQKVEMLFEYQWRGKMLFSHVSPKNFKTNEGISSLLIINDQC